MTETSLTPDLFIFVFQEFSQGAEEVRPHPQTRPPPGAPQGEVHEKSQAVAEDIVARNFLRPHNPGHPLGETTPHHQPLQLTSASEKVGVVNQKWGVSHYQIRKYTEYF